MRRPVATAVLALTLALPGVAQEPARAEARFRCEPAQVEVGEPFDLVLELEHRSGADLFAVGDGEPVLDESWVQLGARVEAPRALAGTGSGDAPRAVTERR